MVHSEHTEYGNGLQFAKSLMDMSTTIFGAGQANDMLRSVNWEVEGDDQLTMNYPYFAVTLGYPVEVARISGRSEIPGYRVWVGEVKSGGMWEPDSMDDVTVSESQHIAVAVRAALYVLVETLLDQAADAEYAAEYGGQL